MEPTHKPVRQVSSGNFTKRGLGEGTNPEVLTCRRKRRSAFFFSVVVYAAKAVGGWDEGTSTGGSGAGRFVMT